MPDNGAFTVLCICIHIYTHTHYVYNNTKYLGPAGKRRGESEMPSEIGHSARVVHIKKVTVPTNSFVNQTNINKCSDCSTKTEVAPM